MTRCAEELEVVGTGGLGPDLVVTSEELNGEAIPYMVMQESWPDE